MATVRRALVIGGGIGGLATAWRLRRRAREQGLALAVTVVEAADRFGGVIRSSREADGCLIEHGPDSIIRTKPAGMRLITDLGLDTQLLGTSPDLSGGLIAKGDRLLPIPPGLYLLAPGRLLPFALSPLVSWLGKLRMGLDLVLPRRKDGLPEESLAAFVRRRLGREALQRIAQPLVGGIYTADPERLSLAHCMPQFLEMEREHRSLILAMRARQKAMAGREGAVSGARYGLFVSLLGGLQTLVDRLLADLAADTHVSLRAACTASWLERRAADWELRCADGDLLHADSVALCLQAGPAAALCRGLDGELSEDLAGIGYASVATVNLAFDAAACPELPMAAGFVVPDVEHRHLIACTFADRKYPGRIPSGTVLLRAFVGGACHEDQLDVDDTELARRCLQDLRRWYPTLPPPRWWRVHRWDKAMAQPYLGHRERLARIRSAEARLPGLALVGNGYEGVGIPDICEQAEAAVERLWPALQEEEAGRR